MTKSFEAFISLLVCAFIMFIRSQNKTNNFDIKTFTVYQIPTIFSQNKDNGLQLVNNNRKLSDKRIFLGKCSKCLHYHPLLRLLFSAWDIIELKRRFIFKQTVIADKGPNWHWLCVNGKIRISPIKWVARIDQLASNQNEVDGNSCIGNLRSFRFGQWSELNAPDGLDDLGAVSMHNRLW